MHRLTSILLGITFSFFAHSADLDAGRDKAQVCTACHGANGVSISDDIPNLVGQKAGYLGKQLKAFRDGSRKNPLMNAIATQLSDADIDNVTAFFNNLGVAQTSETSAVGKALATSKIAFPSDYKEAFTLYSKVNQADLKRVRHNLTNAAALQGPDSQGRFPNGTFVLTEIYAAKLDQDGNPVSGDDGFFVADKLLALATMEKQADWGDEVPEVLRNGDWNYALFGADQTLKTDANQAACLACHKPLPDADYLFSYKELISKAQE